MVLIAVWIWAVCAGILTSITTPLVIHSGPEVMIRMLVIGYCYGIRSERRLYEDMHRNLAYRWFRPLGLTIRFRTTRLLP